MELMNPWGWSEFFEAELKSLGTTHDGVPARVICEEREEYILGLRDGKVLRAGVSGKLRFQAKGREAYPSVGDWVLVKVSTSDAGVIQHVFTRKTCIKRQAAGDKPITQILASNIDLVMVAASANQDFNPRRLERYLIACAQSGAESVVLLTKCDLIDNPKELIDQILKLRAGIEVIAVSVKSGLGIDRVRERVGEGTTSVLIGSSGVGKSTLINALTGEETLKTQEVRLRDDRGKHTTSKRQILHLPTGGLIIDTPGLREFQLLDQDGELEGLDQTFAEIEAIARTCKFSNCVHVTEPGCQIKAALESGELPKSRYEHFLKLAQESAARAKKRDPQFRGPKKNKP